MISYEIIDLGPKLQNACPSDQREKKRGRTGIFPYQVSAIETNFVWLMRLYRDREWKTLMK